MSITTINPATGEQIRDWPVTSPADLNVILDASHTAHQHWARISIGSRAEKIRDIAKLLTTEKTRCATLISTEMGKPLTAAIAEIEKCAWLCREMADRAELWLAPRSIKTEMSESTVICRPLGTVFAIMPWNFPYWQVFRFAIPALLAGNSALLKPAPVTTGCGVDIEDLFRRSGLPDGLFRTLILDNDHIEPVVAHPAVSAVTFTGSDRTGRIVGALAGKYLKKVVLEMGGSDPFVVLADADPEQAADCAVASRMNNAGQVCIAAKRLIAVPAIRDTFQKLVTEKLARYVAGDPLNSKTTLGPMARADLRVTLHDQIKRSVAQGAKCLLGGTLPDGPGFYYPPTILTGVKKGMPAYDEELFGPVMTFIDARDEKHAIALANDTQYGLAACLFSGDISRAKKIAAEEIEAGTVFVNDMVRSDPRLPFGGIKQSGYGRELGEEGIREFVNVKTIAVK